MKRSLIVYGLNPWEVPQVPIFKSNLLTSRNIFRSDPRFSFRGDAEKNKIGVDMDKLLQDYKIYLAVEYRKFYTRQQYYRIAKDLIRFKGSNEITKDIVNSYVADLNTRQSKKSGEKLSYNTICCHLIGLNIFLEYLGKQELKPKIKQYKPTVRNTISYDQIIAIGEVAKKDPLHELIYYMIVHQNARPIEIVNLKFSNIQSNKLFFTDTKTGSNYNFLTYATINAIYRYKDIRTTPLKGYEDYILIVPKGKHKGKKYSNRANIIRDIIAKIGNGITPYDLRASAITEAFNQYVNPKIIQRNARHRNLKTTEMYNHVSDKDLEEYASMGTIFNNGNNSNILHKKRKQSVINDLVYNSYPLQDFINFYEEGNGSLTFSFYSFLNEYGWEGFEVFLKFLSWGVLPFQPTFLYGGEFYNMVY